MRCIGRRDPHPGSVGVSDGLLHALEELRAGEALVEERPTAARAHVAHLRTAHRSGTVRMACTAGMQAQRWCAGWPATHRQAMHLATEVGRHDLARQNLQHDVAVRPAHGCMV